MRVCINPASGTDRQTDCDNHWALLRDLQKWASEGSMAFQAWDTMGTPNPDKRSPLVTPTLRDHKEESGITLSEQF